MENRENTLDDVAPTPEKKRNLSAKIGVALTMGIFVGGKLSWPGMFLDANNMFPKGTPLGEKFSRTFSREIKPLMEHAIALEKAKGHHEITAFLIATKWTTIVPTLVGIGLGIIGWKRANLLQDSSDIIHHPLKSTKIILGLEPPDPVPSKVPTEAKGKHSETLIAERNEQAEIQTQR